MCALRTVLFSSLLLTVPLWTPQISNVTARLRGVSAPGAQVAWASGAGGTILRTLDGGATWKRRTIPGTETLDFRDVDAFSDSVAYVLSIGPGEASRIYKTMDGGLSWVLQHTNREPKGFLDSMAFWSAERGMVVGDAIDGRFYVLKTENGGRTWNRVDPRRMPAALAGEGAFAASGTNVAVRAPGHVWIGTSKSRVVYSSDGGETWSVSSTGLEVTPTAGVFSVAFADERRGMAVGGDFTKEKQAGEHVALTSDGGATWRKASSSGFRSAAAYGGGAALAVGPSGAEISRDGGLRWEPVAGEGFHAFSVVPGQAMGWGVGENGRISLLRW